MRKIIFSVCAICLLSAIVTGQTRINESLVMDKSLDTIQLRQDRFDKELEQLLEILDKNQRNIQTIELHNKTLCKSIDSLRGIHNNLKKLSDISAKNRRNIQTLEQHNEALCKSIDSLRAICNNLKKAQTDDRVAINEKIQNTKNMVASNQATIKSRTWGGGTIIVIILLALSVGSYYLSKRIKRGASSIDEVRKIQDVLQAAQIKMQEESVKLYGKMIELCEHQIQATPTKTESTQADHSLALKVADEIVRIETNLSHMDTSIKGYKQLLKAVQRIKDNFNANGYEIVDMLGKPYVVGMKAAVTFVTDENLEYGQQIITKIIKPQINYQQQMIQAAQIEVSQPE